MIPEIGHFLLIFAAIVSIVAAGGIFTGYYTRNQYIAGLWRPALGLVMASLSVSLACLVYAFLTNDFSVAYVANHSNTDLEPIYKTAAVWGSHEGSMLLWIWIIAAWASCFLLFTKGTDDSMGKNQAIVLGILGIFCIFLLATSNPFARTLPFVPTQGKDLNPILQDIGMILHPPILFLGYAGLTFCFGTAIAFLLSGRLTKGRVDQLRKWTVITWIFLTAGNLLGSWWAYRELGWGGWWFWDPVENASFIPWLLVTAQLHALMLAQYREHLQRSMVFLCLAAFAMCLFGTFIVRSGMMQSVHAFAADPDRGIFLLSAGLLILVPGFIVYFLRAKFLRGASIDELDLGDLGLVTAVMLLTAAAVCVLFGTIYPMIHETINGISISVGTPYFNSVFGPLTVLAAVLIGFFQLSSANWFWKSVAFIVALFPSIVIPYATAPKSPYVAAAGLFASFWIMASAVIWIGHMKQKTNLFALIAHLGIAISIIGVVGDTQYQQEALVRMGPGNGRELSDVVFVYQQTNKVNNKSFYADEGEVSVLDKDEKEITVLRPQRQTFKSNGMEMTHAGIEQGILRDLYVSMGNKLSESEYLVRLNVKPFMSWLWIGGLVMIGSGALALTRRRKKNLEIEQNA